MIEILPEEVVGRLQPLLIKNTMLYQYNGKFYFQLCLDIFGHYTESRKIQVVLNDQILTSAAINAYFKVNIIYFIYEFLESLSFMSLEDIVSTVKAQYKINVQDYLKMPLFDEMNVDGDIMYRFNSDKFIQYIKDRFKALKEVFEEQDALKFMLLFFPKQFVETNLGIIKVVKQPDSPKPQQTKKWQNRNKKPFKFQKH